VDGNGELEAGEVDTQRALCVEGANVEVGGGGCSVAASSDLSRGWMTLSLVAAALFWSRRRSLVKSRRREPRRCA